MTRLLVLLLVLLIGATSAQAHEVRPALLSIKRTAEDVCRIEWKYPSGDEAIARLRLRLSGGWTDGIPSAVVEGPNFRTDKWLRYPCRIAALNAQKVSVEGLEGTLTDVFVEIDYGDGEVRRDVLRSGQEAISLERSQPPLYGTLAYYRLGIQHILTGIDHLAFVLALVLLVGLRKRLFVAITFFTVAHSITLGLTALGVVATSPALIEALVALSIAFVAAELIHLRRGRSTLTIRHPQLLALAFGFLHGFAFAGSLAQIGLPAHDKLLALLLFNLGVESGQLLFIAAVVGVMRMLRARSVRLAPWCGRLAPYAIGIPAGFWFVQRLAQIV